MAAIRAPQISTWFRCAFMSSKWKFFGTLLIILFHVLQCASSADPSFECDICPCFRANAGSSIPRFQARTSLNPTDPSVFYVDPCTQFSRGNSSDPNSCSASPVLVCQELSGKSLNLGDLSSVQRQLSSATGKPYISLKHGVESEERQTQIFLTCNTSTWLEVQGEMPPGSRKYLMYLHTPCVCSCQAHSTQTRERAGNLGATESGGLSIGSILVIVFFVGVILYLIIGMIILRVVRGAEGWEMIPNRNFWMDFPGLMKDGVVFVLGGCRAESTYDRL